MGGSRVRNLGEGRKQSKEPRRGVMVEGGRGEEKGGG